MATSPWQRRARPLLGTLVEVGIAGDAGYADPSWTDAAFAAIAAAEACLSRFKATSDIARFNDVLQVGEQFAVQPATREVLRAAAHLQLSSDGAFDITLGSGACGWSLTGKLLRKLAAGTRLDLGGIGKGHAVDRAVRALQAAGCGAGWVNAGGDVRAFGPCALPLHLRDEQHGGTRPFASLQDGAFATSRFGGDARARLHGLAGSGANVHISVAAPTCLWADALTKVVAARGLPASSSLLARHGATAWLH